MKAFAAIGGLLLFAASAIAADAPVQKGLVVHEWGVFYVNTDAAFANAGLRAEWDELPEFVYGHIKGRVVSQHWGAFESRRQPIIFFHAAAPAIVRVKVEFPGGEAGVWFPATEKPAILGAEKQPKVGNSLEWKLGIKGRPNGWQPKNADLQIVEGKHWINRVRQVKSDDIYSQYGPNFIDVERDKFLYYDGIFPQGKWLKVDVDKDSVALANQAQHAVFDVTIVDRRGDKVRVGRVAKLEAGERLEKVAFADADASSFASEASEALLKQLTAAGLFEDEAQSLVDLRKKDLFETPGLNLFFRLPQAEYDVRLPLSIVPKPETTVRVGLVHQAHLEPDFAENILELVKHLDSPKFATRDAAVKKLHLIGPAALVQLQRIRERKDLSVEVRERIDAMVKKWNVKDAFDTNAETSKPRK